MTSSPDLPVKSGDLARVTFTAPDGQVAVWRGTFTGVRPVVVHTHPDGRFFHEEHLPTSTPEQGRPFVFLTPTVNGDSERSFLVHGWLDRSHDFFAHRYRLAFAVGAPGWTITAADDADLRLLAKQESPGSARRRLIERFASFDSQAAEDLDDVIDALVCRAKYAD